MQQLAGRAKVWGSALAWIIGLLLAGSEGEWMPCLNFLGGFVFFGATLCLGKILPELEQGSMTNRQDSPPSVRRSKAEVNHRLTGKLGIV